MAACIGGPNGKNINSAEEIKSVKQLKEYLGRQSDNSPDKPVEVTMKADKKMFGKITEALNSAEKYVHLKLSGNALSAIPDNAFVVLYEDGEGGCQYLTGITIPDSVTGIGKNAFAYSGLTGITIPGSVKNIGFAAFYGCDSLAGVTIENGVTGIGDCAFRQCTSLTGITIPDSVKSIGEVAFDGCTKLSGVSIGNGVTGIGSFAFSFCHSLSSITIPAGVTKIGDYAFAACKKLTAINVAADNPYYTARDGVLYNKDKTALHTCPAGKIPGFAIPAGVTGIGERAFQGCAGLAYIQIPDSVTDIGNCAFLDCTGIGSITIPNSVKNIGESAFSGCTGLTGVTIGNGVTGIGMSAFSGCTNITKVIFQGTIAQGGFSSMAFYGLGSLRDTFYAPPNTGNGTPGIYTRSGNAKDPYVWARTEGR